VCEAGPHLRSPLQIRGEPKTDRDTAGQIARGRRFRGRSRRLATVKAHVSRLLIKLDADNRVQIALLV
jgi:hypothetical protein